MNELVVLDERVVLEKQFKVYGTKENPLFLAKDVAEWIDYCKTGNGSRDVSSMLKNVDEDEKIKMYCTIIGRKPCDSMDSANRWFVTEDGLYELLMISKTPIAKQFKKEVKKILKQIRQTGGYIPTEPEDTPEELMARALIIANKTLELKEQRIKELEINNKQLTTEVTHKENVIIGLVDDIDLETKRQRINQIIRYGANGRYSERWSLLYKEFEGKFHINIKRRMESEEVKAMKPKIKSKMDYIDRVLNMTPQLYELSCKVFENDVNKLREEWESTIQREFED